MHFLLLLALNKKFKFFDKNMAELKKRKTTKQNQINQTEPPTTTEALQ